MTDIIIYTKPKTLEHKKDADDCARYYWTLATAPIRFEEGEKIYFATKGFIRGYFICDVFDPEDPVDETLQWWADSWVELKEPIPTKPFQGFKYKDW